MARGEQLLFKGFDVSPQDGDAVLGEDGIERHDREPVGQSLSDHKPIPGVAVGARQLARGDRGYLKRLTHVLAVSERSVSRKSTPGTP